MGPAGEQPSGVSNQWACAPHSGFGAPPLAALVPAGGAQGHALLLVVTEGGGEAPARGGDSAARLAWETAGGYCGVLRHCLRGAGAHSGGAGSGPVRAEPSLRGPFGTCAECSLNRGSRACISSVLGDCGPDRSTSSRVISYRTISGVRIENNGYLWKDGRGKTDESF